MYHSHRWIAKRERRSSQGNLGGGQDGVPLRINVQKRWKMLGFLRNIRTREKKKDPKQSLAESYLSRASDEEKDAFTEYISKHGHDMASFGRMDDIHAMQIINRFRATEWYRRYGILYRVSILIDPSSESRYTARKGALCGHVAISHGFRNPPIKGYCHNCGRQLVDYDFCYKSGDICHCLSCFELYKKHRPVMVHHIPGCVDTGNEFTYHLWKGWEDFIQKYPLQEGWHYEWHDNHLMDVKNDRSEWWVTWNIWHPDILKEIMDRCPEWKWHR